MFARSLFGLVVVLGGFFGTACTAQTDSVDASSDEVRASNSDDAFVVSVLKSVNTPVLVSAVIGRGVSSTRIAQVALKTTAGGLTGAVFHDGTVSSQDGETQFGTVAANDFARLEKILSAHSATVFDPPHPPCCDFPSRHDVTAIVSCSGEGAIARCTFKPVVSDDDFMAAILEKAGVPALVSSVVGGDSTLTRKAHVVLDHTTGGIAGGTRLTGKIESEDGMTNYGTIAKDDFAQVEKILVANGAVATEPGAPPCCDRTSTSSVSATVTCSGSGANAECSYEPDAVAQ
jgi:hypothetical protein